MGVPALLRTWQFQVSQVLAPQAATLATNQLLGFSLKQSMKGAGSWTDSTGAATASSGNWLVRGSSDGIGNFGNNDNVDRWVSSANLIWAAAASNHSWIVLEQAGIPGAAGNFQVCIDLSNASSVSATVVVSPSVGFTAGTATARPTAADEQVIISNTSWGGVSGNAPCALHVMKTADGASTRIIAMRTSTNGSGAWSVLFYMFELPVNMVKNAAGATAWTNPSAAVALGNSAQAPTGGLDTVTNLSNTANTFSRTPGGTNFASTWSAEATQQHALLSDSYGSVNGGQQNVSDVNGEAPMFPIGLYSVVVNARGRNGSLADVRLGLENISTNFNAATGRSYPTAAPLKQWVQFGDFIHPWNRSVPVVLS
jgi:hypothetical protein